MYTPRAGSSFYWAGKAFPVISVLVDFPCLGQWQRHADGDLSPQAALLRVQAILTGVRRTRSQDKQQGQTHQDSLDFLGMEQEFLIETLIFLVFAKYILWKTTIFLF